MTGFGAAEAKNQSAVAAASPQQQLLISLIKAAGVDGNGSSNLETGSGARFNKFLPKMSICIFLYFPHETSIAKDM